MKQHLCEFTGMPGVKRNLKGPLVNSITAFMREISKHRIVSDAGSYGSLIIYRDDKGVLRGERHVRHNTEDRAEFKTKKEMRAWLSGQLPRCHSNIMPPA